MSEMPVNDMNTSSDNSSTWGAELVYATCEGCDWHFLTHPAALSEPCPHCFARKLTAVEAEPGTREPELHLPYRVTSSGLSLSIDRFTEGLWFPPGDLTATNLKSRMRRVYLPVWLVDCDAQADWQAEVGFNYAVVSHQDRYEDRAGGWSSREVNETRVRWEPRLGRLQRAYQNITAPALNEHRQLLRLLGEFNYQPTQAYTPEGVELKGAAGWYACMPNRSPQDAWPDVQPSLQAAAADECRQASAADHFRDFRWNPSFSNQKWTLLLLPVLTTFYLDDERKPQPVLINGQSGRLSGVRRASPKRAQNAALWLAASAFGVFFLSLVLSALGVLFPPLLAVAGLGFLLALALGVGAIVPFVVVWQVNKAPREYKST